jgi:hypothetical protein
MRNPDPMRQAIETTHVAIQDRAKLYRKLVVCVSFLLLASIISAIVVRRAIPLAGIVLLVPLAGTYFVLDGRLTRRWMREVLELWARRELDLEAFATAIRAHPWLPQRTVEGLLAGLSWGSHETRPASLSGDDRKAVIARLEREASGHEWRTVLATAALLSALLCLGAAALLRSGWLLGWSFLSIVVWIRCRRRRASG